MTVAGVLRTLTWFTLTYLIAVSVYQTALIVSAALSLRAHRLTTVGEERRWLLGSAIVPRVSILAPAHNEEPTVVETVRSLLSLWYPSFELVLINDGSQDGTLEVLHDAFALEEVHPLRHEGLTSRPIRSVMRSRIHPELTVVDKVNGGKADALNAGLRLAGGELVCAIDADTLLEPDALLRMVRPFMRREDVVAAGGTVRAVNESLVSHGQVVRVRAPRRLLPGVQVVEYLRAFLFGRLGWNRLGGNLIISGAFGMFRRSEVVAVGGYKVGSVGEDAELVVALRRRANATGAPGWIEFVPDPIAWTEVPTDLGSLSRQRNRWHRGLAEVLVGNAGIIANPRERALGLVVAPTFLLFELLAPVVEALGVVMLIAALAVGAVDVDVALFFFLAAYGFGILVNLATLLLEQNTYDLYRDWQDKAFLLLWGAVEGIVFRPLTVVWRLRGLWSYARRDSGWGTMVRRGFAAPASPGTSQDPARA